MGQKHNDQDDLIIATPTSMIQIQPTLAESTLVAITPVRPTQVPSSTPSLFPTLVSIPTSDFQNIKRVIFTPAPPVDCPPIATSKIAIPETLPDDEPKYEEVILEILNSGGIEQLMTRLPDFKYLDFKYEDLTNDGVRELTISNPTLRGNLIAFGCKDGEFVNLLTINPAYEYGPHILAVQDINRDGVKELVVDMLTCHYCTGIMVYEWNGQDFESLVKAWRIDYSSNKLDYWTVAELDGYTEASIEDVDNNGTFELVLDGGIPSYLGAMTGWEGPWRGQRVIYMWDGEHYVWYSQKYKAPSFRFEAIQDGDRETVNGNYDSALSFYQDAIFNDRLKSWTEDVWHKLLLQNEEAQSLRYPDIQKMPFNQAEYDQLSAYARYRIMILHLKRGWEEDAKVVYQTLQAMFPEGSLGYPYTEIASEFWNEYQISHDLVRSCDKAISYATINEDILIPLGNHGNGLWELSYSPQSICPFK